MHYRGGDNDEPAQWRKLRSYSNNRSNASTIVWPRCNRGDGRIGVSEASREKRAPSCALDFTENEETLSRFRSVLQHVW